MDAQSIAGLKELYNVDECSGIVRSLGKFEGEWYPSIYYWRLTGEGEDDLLIMDETYVSVFTVNEEDIKLIPDLAEFAAVAVWEDGDGSVRGKYYTSSHELYQDWQE